jgi:fatty-acyl-CoA synthase
LREWCRQNLAGFKVPSEFRFEPIPKTSTGKIQKYALRQRIAAGVDPD